MSTQVQFRRGTTVEHSGFTGAIGEVTVDTVKQTCVVHDATQAGGYPLLREDGTNASLSLGSLTSCALKFAGDADTGIISPGVNQIALVTGGVARLTIDGSGAVTILYFNRQPCNYCCFRLIWQILSRTIRSPAW